MKTIWYIAKKDLLQTLRDWNSFILLLAVPLVLITIVGLAVNNLSGSPSRQIGITVAVSNQDGGAVGEAMVDALKVDTDQLKIIVNQYKDTRQVTDQIVNNDE